MQFKKAEILALLDAGQYEHAIQLADAWLATSPSDSDALYASGLVHLFAEQYEKSISLLQQAVKQKPEDAVYLANLGIACLRAGDTCSAISNLTKAIEKQPDYSLAIYNLGSAYIQNKQAELALTTYSSLVKKEPDNAEYLCALADATRETGQWQQSVKLYKKVLSLDDNHYRAHTNMGPLMMHTGQIDDAIKHCDKAITIKPEQTLARKNLGDCYQQIERLDEAMEKYADAYEIDPDNAELCVAIGNVWLETAEPAEASTWFIRAINIDENNILAHCGLANIERDSGNLQQALNLITPVHEREPDNVDVLLCLADILWDDGDAQSALLHLKTVQKLQPQRTAIYSKTGHILSSAGDIAGALSQYESAMQLNPKCIPVLNGLATSLRGRLDADCVTTMHDLLDQNGDDNSIRLKAGARASLHNGLAYYYDGCQQYEKAAKHMQLANEFQWRHKSIRGWQYDISDHESYITQLINTFDTEYFENLDEDRRDDAGKSEAPVFIIAMPRSGTTLTEQILAQHNNILGVGERNFATQSFNQLNINQPVDRKNKQTFKIDIDRVRNLDPKKIAESSKKYLDKLEDLADKTNKTGISRIVDKMPDNYSMVGWILTLFPKAKIIHLQREPADVALSCWMTQFGAIRWACDKQHIIHRIQQYKRIMEHWRDTIPGRFIEIRYEDLIANQEAESRRLIEYIGLEWDSNCLKFYESERLVRTASITQVRQPVYKRSVKRWRAYQPYLSDLFNQLGE